MYKDLEERYESFKNKNEILESDLKNKKNKNKSFKYELNIKINLIIELENKLKDIRNINNELINNIN